VLRVNILQCGPDTVQPPSGDPVTFTHEPLPLVFEYNYTTQTITVPGTIGDVTQGFTGLSPFATWILDFSDPANSWLDLSTLSSVELVFAGQLLGSNAAAAKKGAKPAEEGEMATAG
jgi:hypothetical protein